MIYPLGSIITIIAVHACDSENYLLIKVKSDPDPRGSNWHPVDNFSWVRFKGEIPGIGVTLDAEAESRFHSGIAEEEELSLTDLCPGCRRALYTL